MTPHRARMALISVAIVTGFGATPTSAQLGGLGGLGASDLVEQFGQSNNRIQVAANDRFAGSSASRNSSLLRILAEGTVVRSENPPRGDVVLFVVHMSKGRIVSRGESSRFRLDPRQTSTSQGMLLGSVISGTQLSRVAPLGRVGESVGRYYATASAPVNAGDLTRQSGVAFNALVSGAFGGEAIGGGYGGGGSAYGGGAPFQTENLLLVAAVPADAETRSRSSVRPMILIF